MKKTSEPASSPAKANDAQSSAVNNSVASGKGAGAQAPKLTTYEVISPLDYNNRRYEIGEPIELPDDIALPLFGRVVRPLGK